MDLHTDTGPVGTAGEYAPLFALCPFSVGERSQVNQLEARAAQTLKQ